MKAISFQGMYGAYSDLVCRKFYKSYKTIPCKTFEETLNAVVSKRSSIAMIPVENSIAGRVADMHLLLERTKLKIVAEYYHKIEHHLLGKHQSEIRDIQRVYSHVHALSQCKKNIIKTKLTPINFIDTAGAASHIANSEKISDGAIASELSAKIYNLKILKRNMEDSPKNFTRFLVFSKVFGKVSMKKKVITTLVFNTRNLPASLYKALGGFATNGINLTRLENFFSNKNFEQSSFLIDVESHPEKTSFINAFEELKYYSSRVKVLGYYEASNYRSLIN